TETGALYFEQARQMMEGLDEVEAAVSQTALAPKGRLRMSAPVWMANPLFAGGAGRLPRAVSGDDVGGRSEWPAGQSRRGRVRSRTSRHGFSRSRADRADHRRCALLFRSLAQASQESRASCLA